MARIEGPYKSGYDWRRVATGGEEMKIAAYRPYAICSSLPVIFNLTTTTTTPIILVTYSSIS